MDWKPISEAELQALIEAAEYTMQPDALALWNRIRIRSVKWQLSPWGDMGSGFWVVAIIGQDCFWYNDIEDGFNVSLYSEFGTIRDYWCSQSRLEECIYAYCEDFVRAIQCDS
jgi:hypothetical protein